MPQTVAAVRFNGQERDALTAASDSRVVEEIVKTVRVSLKQATGPVTALLRQVDLEPQGLKEAADVLTEQARLLEALPASDVVQRHRQDVETALTLVREALELFTQPA